MAPLSYYWLISFIYLVMVKFEIFALLVINRNNRMVTLRDNSTPVYDFFLVIPTEIELLLYLIYRGKKKICIYGSIRYYEIQMVGQQVQKLW
jgi:hypothetical protein